MLIGGAAGVPDKQRAGRTAGAAAPTAELTAADAKSTVVRRPVVIRPAPANAARALSRARGVGGAFPELPTITVLTPARLHAPHERGALGTSPPEMGNGGK